MTTVLGVNYTAARYPALAAVSTGEKGHLLKGLAFRGADRLAVASRVPSGKSSGDARYGKSHGQATTGRPAGRRRSSVKGTARAVATTADGLGRQRRAQVAAAPTRPRLAPYSPGARNRGTTPSRPTVGLSRTIEVPTTTGPRVAIEGAPGPACPSGYSPTTSRSREPHATEVNGQVGLPQAAPRGRTPVLH